MRFAAAVQAALEDGYRVFAELSPHPLLTHAAEQTADSLGMSRWPRSPAMRREQELPDGLRGFLADLYSAGAAIDFSLRHPQGRLVDAPLPAWTNRRLFLEPRRSAFARRAAARTVAVHPLMGAHVQVQEQPERHVWQGEVGTVAQPWLGDYQIHDAAALPGAAYCEMALAAARTVLGEASELRDIRIEQSLMLDEETPIGAVASVEAPGVLPFAVETIKDGKHARWATAVLRTVEDTDQPPAIDIAALLATHPRRVDGAAGSGLVRAAWCSIRSRLHRSDVRAHLRGHRRHGAGRGRTAALAPLAAIRLRRAPGAAGRLLPVGGSPSQRRADRERRSAVAAGCASAACLRIHPHTPATASRG